MHGCAYLHGCHVSHVAYLSQGQPRLPDLFEVAEQYVRDNIAMIGNVDTHMMLASTPYLHLMDKGSLLALSRRAFTLAGERGEEGCIDNMSPVRVDAPPRC